MTVWPPISATLRAVALAVTFLAAAGGAVAEPRIALVIGNSNYTGDLGRLPNPANDARLMAKTLKGIGFEVIEAEDADHAKMKRVIQDFGERLATAGGGSTGLFYYAGHGLQVAGTNYLIPIHAKIAREPDVDIEAVPIDLVMKQMEYAESAVNIVILDACRNNPLSRGFRSAVRGLADPAIRPMGSFVAYSTAPGDVAEDGDGANSPYTTALAESITRPGASINDIFQEVRGKVLAATERKQVPWDSSSLTAPFYFVPAAVTPTAKATEAETLELAFWNEVKDSDAAEDYQAYLARFPDGVFAPLAERRLKQADPSASRVLHQSPDAEVSIAPSQADAAAFESAFWSAVEEDQLIEGYRSYLDKYPNGMHAERAQERLAALSAPAAAASPAIVSDQPPPAEPLTVAMPSTPEGADSEACLGTAEVQPGARAEACRHLLDAGLEDETDHYNALMRLGDALLEQEQYDEALRTFRAASERDPYFFGAHYKIGRVHLKERRYAEARAAFDQASERDPTEPDPIMYRGAALRRMGDFDAALAEIERAIVLNPDETGYYDELSYLHLYKGDIAGAVADTDKALALYPAYWTAPGIFSLYFAGRYDEAEAMADRATKGAPGFIYWWVWKAMVQRAQGDAAAAAATLAEGRKAFGKPAWPVPLLDYIDGAISEAEVRRLARSNEPTTEAERLTEIAFYTGERLALAGDRAAATAAFRQAMEGRVFHYIEYMVAPAWIAVLNRS